MRPQWVQLQMLIQWATWVEVSIYGDLTMLIMRKKFAGQKLFMPVFVTGDIMEWLAVQMIVYSVETDIIVSINLNLLS